MLDWEKQLAPKQIDVSQASLLCKWLKDVTIVIYFPKD